jgi:phosphomevalonate kinase
MIVSKSQILQKEKYLFKTHSLKDEVQSKIRPAKKSGRKPQNLGLSQRKDVVLKTLLRKMRFFFWNDFNSFSGFKKKIYRSKDPLLYEK